jgi:predicted CxxxxCH...CXXCH cytochrome family protein
MTKIFISYLAAISLLILISACSELNNDIPSVPKISTHGEGVFDSSSSSFHPYTISNYSNGIYSCTQCHAANFSGGTAGIGCNTTDCHPGLEVHVTGFLDTTNINFHGNYIKNHSWDMIRCQSCHGENYAGDELSPSCLNCHSNPGGPENCTTCHGGEGSNAPPKDISGNTSSTEKGVGSHQPHLDGNVLGRKLICTECHNVPGGVYTAGHVDSDLPAEVIMNSTRANVSTNNDSSLFDFFDIDPDQITYIPTPTYNYSELSCSNTYCHGYFKNGNIGNTPVWTDPSAAACGSCHGNESSPLPLTESQGGSHPDAVDCINCHFGVINANMEIIDPSKHIDGKLHLFGSDFDF